METERSRLEELFFALFESLPRQGPGSRACTARAFERCRGLPASPAVLDLGCGAGAQTLDLAELGAGSLVAVDRHVPNVERLHATVAARGLERRIRPVVGDFARLPLRPASFDLVWSEGALYTIGLETALPICRAQLRPGGWLAFTDAVWLAADPPAEVRAAFADYPTMGSVPDVRATVAASGFELCEHFTLPEAAWWDELYTPLVERIEKLRGEHAGDAETLAALDEIAAEPELRRRHAGSYGYEFFVARRA